MLPGKRISLGAGGIAAAIFAALLITVGTLDTFVPVDWVADISLAAITGALVAFLTWLLVGRRLDRELLAVHRTVAACHHKELSTAPMPASRWLGPLRDSLSRTLDELRERIADLYRQRRELEIQLKVADAELQHVEAILHSISDAVLVTDAFNELAMANDAAARLFEFDREQFKHQPLDHALPDPALVKLIKDTRDSGHVSHRRHVEHRLGQNGRTQIYDVTLACVANPQQEVAGVVTILHDITREKEISEMKSDFVSNVSHELRTPLSSIKAYVEMLVDGEANDEETRTEFYNIIQSETNRLSRLIDNILNISRIESGVVKVQREHLSLPAVIREVVEVMQPQARAKQILLEDQESPLFYQIYADKDMIYQALLNLVGNAIKYTPARGKVRLWTEVDEHRRVAHVHVQDTGVGIPPQDLPRLFQKFYRVKDHKNLAKGTGLGLNLVKHIVETVHSGTVQVTSVQGEGSDFGFSLPLSDGAA